MIIVDTIYINNGGGKVLLDQLIEEVNNRQLEVLFLLDKRLSNKYNLNSFTLKPLILESRLYTRYNFYKNLNDGNHIILCFGNIPPPLKLRNSIVYTYLHNVLYLEPKSYLSFLKKIHLELKKIYFKLIVSNTTYWIVQTNNVKNKLIGYTKVSSEKVIVCPFYNVTNTNIKSEKNEILTYLYVSSGEAYKNHLRLFKAFEHFAKKKKNVQLIVTLPIFYKSLLKIINRLKKKNIKIINVGFINKLELDKIYSKSDIFIFPSLFESFGLGLIEAVNAKLDVISSNYEYVFDVIEPSLVFNPLDENSILNALEFSYTNKLTKPILKTENKINQLIKILENKYEK